MTTVSGAAGASPPSAEMMEMLHIAQELAHDGTVQGTLRALELVTDIIRQTRPGGENAVMQALKEAKNNHQRVVASSTRPDSTVDGTNWVLLCPVGSMEELQSKDSLLGEGGRASVIQDAAEDGSSVLCHKCMCLVAKDRLDAHVTRWCSALPEDQDQE